MPLYIDFPDKPPKFQWTPPEGPLSTPLLHPPSLLQILDPVLVLPVGLLWLLILYICRNLPAQCPGPLVSPTYFMPIDPVALGQVGNGERMDHRSLAWPCSCIYMDTVGFCDVHPLSSFYVPQLNLEEWTLLDARNYISGIFFSF